MKTPNPIDGYFYIQRLTSSGWEFAQCDGPAGESRHYETTQAMLERLVRINPDREYRIVRARVTTTLEIIE